MLTVHLRIKNAKPVGTKTVGSATVSHFPLTVSNNESDIIRRLDEEGRRKHLASSMIGMMKVAEMVVVLAGEGASSSGRVKELEPQKTTLQAKTQKLKTTLERSEEMFREQADALAGEKERDEKALGEKDCLMLYKELWESER